MKLWVGKSAQLSARGVASEGWVSTLRERVEGKVSGGGFMVQNPSFKFQVSSFRLAQEQSGHRWRAAGAIAHAEIVRSLSRSGSGVMEGSLGF